MERCVVGNIVQFWWAEKASEDGGTAIIVEWDAFVGKKPAVIKATASTALHK